MGPQWKLIWPRWLLGTRVYQPVGSVKEWDKDLFGRHHLDLVWWGDKRVSMGSVLLAYPYDWNNTDTGRMWYILPGRWYPDGYLPFWRGHLMDVPYYVLICIFYTKHSTTSRFLGRCSSTTLLQSPSYYRILSISKTFTVTGQYNNKSIPNFKK